MERDANKYRDTSSQLHSDLIDQVLENLRKKIRAYVLWQGLSLAAIWVAVSFWIALALDYGPVWFGLAEMPRTWRFVLLVLIVTVLGVVLYQWVFRRIYRQLSPANLAMLLERRFPELNDALATVVQAPELSEESELPQRSTEEWQQAKKHHQLMLEESRAHAERILETTSLKEVFNFRPLGVALLGVALLTVSVVGFATTQNSAFLTALRRVYLLDNLQWPRDCHVELVGLKVKYAEPVTGIPEMNQPLSFVDDRAVVTRNSNVSLLTRAALPSPSDEQHRLPRLCEFIYRTADGQRGRLPMNKIGGARDGFQNYALEGELLERVADDIEFYIRGDDHTIGPFTIQAVNAPAVISTNLDCDYPEYLVDVASSRFTSREVPYAAGMSLPIGTQAALVVKFDTPLADAFLLDAENNLIARPEWEQATCTVKLPEIQQTQNFGLLVKGVQGDFLPLPLEFLVNAEEDRPPQIASRLKGIGNAVTPEARIPVISEISDQHGIQKTWIELQTPLTDIIELNQTTTEGVLESEVDLRQIRTAGTLPTDLPTDPPAEIVLTVIAKDHFNLQGDENIGAGTQHPLEVVSADKLLRILEREEAGQRFRLEQIFQEMGDARGYLVRARISRANQENTNEERLPVNSDAAVISAADWELRQLFLQRSLLQAQKSRQEIQAVAFTFADIRLQLIHNRIDAEDRKKRLADNVVDPLEGIVNGSLPDLESRLVEAEEILQSLTNLSLTTANSQSLIEQAEQKSIEALAAADIVLSELQQVLNALLKFETQNELLDLVRRMLEQQEDLKKRTEAMRNKEAFDDIFNK